MLRRCYVGIAESCNKVDEVPRVERSTDMLVVGLDSWASIGRRTGRHLYIIYHGVDTLLGDVVVREQKSFM